MTQKKKAKIKVRVKKVTKPEPKKQVLDAELEIEDGPEITPFEEIPEGIFDFEVPVEPHHTWRDWLKSIFKAKE